MRSTGVSREGKRVGESEESCSKRKILVRLSFATWRRKLPHPDCNDFRQDESPSPAGRGQGERGLRGAGVPREGGGVGES